MHITKILPLGAALALALAGTGRGATLLAQSAQLPTQTVSLADMSGFRPAAGNWRVAGAVEADRSRDQRMQAEAGTGILVNLPGRAGRDNLVTAWEHGDLELELEFMMPKGSNSGIYLQGRYELQLLDSWGVDQPTYADAGGIYERWDDARGRGREGYEGIPPRVNASRAPGLWQRLRIVFQAPRFDAQGRKVANARFVRVEQNGVVIHENVEVTGPTRGAAFPQEGPQGPIVIQGDHGPVAFRKISYKRFGAQPVRLSNLAYRVYEGDFKSLPDVASLTARRQGQATGISSALAGVRDKFALATEGTLEVPAAGRYLFELRFDWLADEDPHFTGVVLGGGRLTVGGREVLVHPGLGKASVTGAVELPAGRHPFSLVYYKNRPWTDRYEIGLFVEGPGVARTALNDESARRASTPPAPILVAPDGEPVVLRSFVRHGESKRTHAVNVADPAGVHYSFDLAQGALLHAWRGPFVETTDMWSGRGSEQIAVPLGSVLTLAGTPALARLADANQPWPDSVVPGAGFHSLGYALDEAGRPAFRYRLGEVEVEDRVRPTDDGNALRRELRVRGPEGAQGLYVRLAEGERVRRLDDGAYAVGDLTYYVVPERGTPRPLIRQAGGREELLVPVSLRRGEASVAYSIVW